MSWALIAGGSKGIGLGIAEALARRNFDLLLIARNEEDLAKTKSRLENEFRVRVETLSCDLSVPGSSEMIYDFCIKKNPELKILCNAAGIGGSKDFPDLPLNDLRAMIRLNFESAVALSYLLIPLLKKGTPSYILNVGSMAGFSPIPIKNVYSATKSALVSFSYSLKSLLKKDNISVSCLCPGPVFTKTSIEKETIKQLGMIGRHMAVCSPSYVKSENDHYTRQTRRVFIISAQNITSAAPGPYIIQTR
jgi:short-subunit dehydrogenase